MPTILQARTAFIALRSIDTVSVEGINATHAFDGNTRIRLAALRLLEKLERVYRATNNDAQNMQIAIESAKTISEQREAIRKRDEFFDQELDEITLAELDPNIYGLRLSAMGWRIFGRVPMNVWKDMGPWFLQDVPDEEVTEEGNANRADRRT